MSDYIKKEDAIEAMKNRFADIMRTHKRRVTTGEKAIASDMIETAKMVKSADVAPVVRCKDCRHAVDYYHEGDCYCSNPKWGLNYFGGSWEFYCADAERRNNE